MPSARKRFSENRPLPSPVRLMVLRYCLGMIMSVSTLIIFKGAATPSSLVNLSISRVLAAALGSFQGASHDGSVVAGQALQRHGCYPLRPIVEANLEPPN